MTVPKMASAPPKTRGTCREPSLSEAQAVIAIPVSFRCCQELGATCVRLKLMKVRRLLTRPRARIELWRDQSINRLPSMASTDHLAQQRQISLPGKMAEQG